MEGRKTRGEAATGIGCPPREEEAATVASQGIGTFQLCFWRGVRIVLPPLSGGVAHRRRVRAPSGDEGRHSPPAGEAEEAEEADAGMTAIRPARHTRTGTGWGEGATALPLLVRRTAGGAQACYAPDPLPRMRRGEPLAGAVAAAWLRGRTTVARAPPPARLRLRRPSGSAFPGRAVSSTVATRAEILSARTDVTGPMEGLGPTPFPGVRYGTLKRTDP